MHSFVNRLEELLLAVIVNMIEVDASCCDICNFPRHMSSRPMNELGTPNPSAGGSVHTVDSIEHFLRAAARFATSPSYSTSQVGAKPKRRGSLATLSHNTSNSTAVIFPSLSPSTSANWRAKKPFHSRFAAPGVSAEASSQNFKNAVLSWRQAETPHGLAVDAQRDLDIDNIRAPPVIIMALNL